MKKTAKTWGFNRFFVKSRKRDSNTRLTDYESVTLPTELFRHMKLLSLSTTSDLFLTNQRKQYHQINIYNTISQILIKRNKKHHKQIKIRCYLNLLFLQHLTKINSHNDFLNSSYVPMEDKMYTPFILCLIFSHLFFSKDFIIKESQKTSNS